MQNNNRILVLPYRNNCLCTGLLRQNIQNPDSLNLFVSNTTNSVISIRYWNKISLSYFCQQINTCLSKILKSKSQRTPNARNIGRWTTISFADAELVYGRSETALSINIQIKGYSTIGINFTVLSSQFFFKNLCLLQNSFFILQMNISRKKGWVQFLVSLLHTLKKKPISGWCYVFIYPNNIINPEVSELFQFSQGVQRRNISLKGIM